MCTHTYYRARTHAHKHTHTHTHTHTSEGTVSWWDLGGGVGQGGHDQHVKLLQRRIILPAQLHYQVLPLGVELVAVQPLHVLHVEAEELDDGLEVVRMGSQASEHRLLHGRGVETFVEVASPWLSERRGYQVWLGERRGYQCLVG